MSETRTAAVEHAIREQAYYFWEQDGRPHGRETEYWIRAVHSVGTAHKPAKPKVKAAASKASTAPARTGKASAAKPKKK